MTKSFIIGLVLGVILGAILVFLGPFVGRYEVIVQGKKPILRVDRLTQKVYYYHVPSGEWVLYTSSNILEKR